MKTALIAAVLLFASASHALPRPEVLDELHGRFVGKDALSRGAAYEWFEKNVPPAERAETLLELWRLEQARKLGAGATIVAWLLEPAAKTIELTPPLQAMLSQAAQSADFDTRAVTLNVLADRGARAERFIPFLRDADDFIRERAVEELATRPGGAKTLKKYVADNATSKKYERSVTRARFFIRKLEKP
jgi:hypothetical protein